MDSNGTRIKDGSLFSFHSILFGSPALMHPMDWADHKLMFNLWNSQYESPPMVPYALETSASPKPISHPHSTMRSNKIHSRFAEVKLLHFFRLLFNTQRSFDHLCSNSGCFKFGNTREGRCSMKSFHKMSRSKSIDGNWSSLTEVWLLNLQREEFTK